MKHLQILGTGCAKCNLLAERTQQAAEAMGVEHTLEKVTDMRKIMAMGVMSTPALAVDGVVKVSGKVPDVETLKSLIGG